MQRIHALRILVSAILIAAFAAGGAVARPAFALTAHGPINVSHCETINAPGSYVLTASFGAAGNCMVIKAPNVSLNLSGFSLNGTGTGKAVVIEDKAENTEVGNGVIDHWGIGVYDHDKAHLSNLTITHSKFYGVQMIHSTGTVLTNNKIQHSGLDAAFLWVATATTVSNNEIDHSGHYGIWLKDSSQFNILNNHILPVIGLAGIFVGCTNFGIKNVLTCHATADGQITGNVVTQSTHLGIAIDRGNNHIHVTGNHVTASQKFDLFESNPACGTNTWTSDVYVTHNRKCAK